MFARKSDATPTTVGSGPRWTKSSRTVQSTQAARLGLHGALRGMSRGHNAGFYESVPLNGDYWSVEVSFGAAEYREHGMGSCRCTSRLRVRTWPPMRRGGSRAS